MYKERDLDVFFPEHPKAPEEPAPHRLRPHPNVYFEPENERRSRLEQEQKIREAKKLRKTVNRTLAVLGLAAGIGLMSVGFHAANKMAFSDAQRVNIANSEVLRSNGVYYDDIDFTDRTMEFDMNDKHYLFKVDYKSVDGEGYRNINGGVCYGKVTYKENGKKITKIFKAEDEQKEKGECNEGVSIDQVFRELNRAPEK